MRNGWAAGERVTAAGLAFISGFDVSWMAMFHPHDSARHVFHLSTNLVYGLCICPQREKDFSMLTQLSKVRLWL